MSTWWEYVQRVSGDQKPARIAERMAEAGHGTIAVSTINDWKNTQPKWQTAVAFADTYQRPRLEALAAAYLDEGSAETRVLLRAASDKDLGEEVYERLAGQSPGET